MTGSLANSGHHESVSQSAESVDKLAQVSLQADKSPNANSTPDFYHQNELTEAFGEQDRNSNFLHHQVRSQEGIIVAN